MADHAFYEAAGNRFAIVRTVGDLGRIEVLAESWHGTDAAPPFSRTLVAAAAIFLGIWLVVRPRRE